VTGQCKFILFKGRGEVFFSFSVVSLQGQEVSSYCQKKPELVGIQLLCFCLLLDKKNVFGTNIIRWSVLFSVKH